VKVILCAYCDSVWHDDGPTIHRDGFGVGPEVNLCSNCGDYGDPTCEQIWDRIAQPSLEPGAHKRAVAPVVSLDAARRRKNGDE
jgi:hypothetical protein